MKHSKCFFILLFLTTLFGCSSKNIQTHDVIFADPIKIELGENNVSTAKYVKRVDSYPVSKSSIDGNQIHVSNITVICPSLKKGSLNRLGQQQIVYRIGDEKYPVTVTVIDKIAPVISLKKDSLTFEVGKMKKLSTYYSVSDNYDKRKDIHIFIHSDKKLNKNKTGVYKLTIKATDSSKNTTSKNLIITIKDSKKEEAERKKKEEEEKKKREQEEQAKSEAEKEQQQEQTSQSQQQSQSISNSASQSSINQNNFSTSNSRPSYSQPQVNNTPVTRDFLFSQGYDMSSAPSACQSALMSSGRTGSCTPIQDNSGIYLGMRLTLN